MSNIYITDCCLLFNELLLLLISRLVLRIAADDPLGAYPFGKKFGCSVEDGKKLLQRCKLLELQVIGVW